MASITVTTSKILCHPCGGIRFCKARTTLPHPHEKMYDNHSPRAVTLKWGRLPKPPERLMGFCRSKLNALILPSESNGFNPPVRSKKVGRSRFINLESLDQYIESQPST